MDLPLVSLTSLFCFLFFLRSEIRDKFAPFLQRVEILLVCSNVAQCLIFSSRPHHYFLIAFPIVDDFSPTVQTIHGNHLAMRTILMFLGTRVERPKFSLVSQKV